MISTTASGRLGRDAERKNFGDRGLLRFSIASDRRTKNGKETDWLDVSLFGSEKRLDALERMLIKGTSVVVTGALKSRKDDQGRVWWGLDATDIDFTGGGGNGGSHKDSIDGLDKAVAYARPGASGYGSKGGSFKDEIDADNVPF